MTGVSTPSNPPASRCEVFFGTDKVLRTIDDAGLVRSLASLAAISATPPSTPKDGDFWMYNGTAGIWWMFGFDSTEATYKWKFVGGGALRAATPVRGVVASMTQIPATTYTTILETLTAPRSGEYEIDHGGIISSQPGTTNSYLGLHINGSLDTASEMVGSLSSPEHFQQSGKVTLTAGDVVTLRTRVDATNANAKYGGRLLKLLPTRVT